MKCKNRYLIPDFIQNKLSQSENDFFAEHIKICNTCKYEYSKLLDVFQIIKDQKENVPDDLYWNNLLPKIHERINSKKTFNPLNYLPQTTVVAVSVLIISLLLMKLSDNFVDYNQKIFTDYDTAQVLDSFEEILYYDQTILSEEMPNDSNNVDKFVLKNILLTSNNVEGFDDEIDALYQMDDDKVKSLLTYLNEERFNER